MNRRALAGLVLIGCATLAGCASDGPDLEPRGAYVPQPPMADMASGYVTVRNTGDAADRLTSVTSDISDDVRMHRAAGATMKPVGSLPVPAGGELRLERGGNHLMLMDLDHRPVRGETVTLVLHFARSGPVKLKVPVEATNYQPRK
ncbi:copper chaperone PCu(A)C [Streptomyces meridianus]|uniref:Copper chaperone PCu(A)C n=1 Tax=Streptomyces meridianus TaxID=2938945 RepID=A0ABT0X7Q6_9ACTN|nr:copper chaperone PCu(A)C [Streptomyces meridianus]MCM2578561.1 copper chaperone PCu(A)C [Streptomyces meridianus]